MSKVQIEEKKVISGSFAPVTIGEDIVLSMKYTVEGDKKSFIAVGKKDEKEVARCNWQPGSRLYMNIEQEIEGTLAVEIAETFTEGLKAVIEL